MIFLVPLITAEMNWELPCYMIESQWQGETQEITLQCCDAIHRVNNTLVKTLIQSAKVLKVVQALGCYSP